MDKPTLAGVVWWPHSGGRWFCRSILKLHPQVHESAFVHPWLFFTTDMTMELDITAQVHKARSLPELKEHLTALKGSIDAGRIAGIRSYFDYIRSNYLEPGSSQTHLIGEMCMGSPIPRELDLGALFEATPDFKLIHLVRSPEESFPSFSIRHELDSNPVKVAGSWVTLNAMIRRFFEKHPDLQNQYLMVRYEDLLSDPDPEMERVCTFLDLPFDPQMLSKLKERWGRNTKPEVPAETKTVIRSIAGQELARFGYE